MTQWIISSSILIVVVLLIRAVGSDRLSARLRYALWGLVLLRLLVPVSIGDSALSVQNWLPHVSASNEQTVVQRPQGQTSVAVQPNLPEASTETIETSDTSDTKETTETFLTNQAPATEQMPVQTAPAVTEAQPAEVNWLPVIWCVGALAVGTVFLLSNLHFALRLRRSRQFLRREAVPVYVAAVETPCLFGVLRPAVYVSADVSGDERAMKHVLAHELTHHRHGDHLWSLLRCVAVTIHWYNSLVWAAAIASQKDGELACDEGALRRLGSDERTDYARTLLGLTCVGYKGVLTTATSMTGSESDLKKRVKRIVKNPKMTVTALAVVVVIAGLASVMLFTGAKVTETLNGVWRSEAIENNLGSEYSPYIYEMYTQYELVDGEGRRTVFRDGDVEQSVHFTYTVQDDELTVHVDKQPYYNPDFEPYEMTLTIKDGNLVEEETVFYPCEIQNPVFLGESLLNVEYLQDWGLGDLERRAYFEFDSYNGALQHLFRQAEVTVLEGAGKTTLDNPTYHWILKGTNLRIADGILYDDENGYLLSNIKDIENILRAMPWEFTRPGTDGIGMAYYNSLQSGVINIKLPFAHGYREVRYYVPGEQSEWQEAIQEVYDNATTTRPDSFDGELLYDNICSGFFISTPEDTIWVWCGGVFGYSEEVQHPDGFPYIEYYFATPEQAPKLTELMDYFINLYEDSYAIGLQDTNAYSGTWVLDKPVPELGITDMILYVDAWQDDQEWYSVSYDSHFMAKQNGQLIKSELAVGVTGEDFLMLHRDGTEYKISHALQDEVLTLYVDGAELRFRKDNVKLEDYTALGDLVLVPRANGNIYDVTLLEGEDRQTFIDLILEGLAAKEETENIIVSNKNFYYLPLMEDVLGVDHDVIMSDLGTIHFGGEAYRLTNWEQVQAFLDTTDLKYTKPLDLYPKG